MWRTRMHTHFFTQKITRFFLHWACTVYAAPNMSEEGESTKTALNEVWRTCNKIQAAIHRVGINLWDYFKVLDPHGNTLISGCDRRTSTDFYCILIYARVFRIKICERIRSTTARSHWPVRGGDHRIDRLFSCSGWSNRVQTTVQCDPFEWWETVESNSI